MKIGVGRFGQWVYGGIYGLEIRWCQNCMRNLLFTNKGDCGKYANPLKHIRNKSTDVASNTECQI